MRSNRTFGRQSTRRKQRFTRRVEEGQQVWSCNRTAPHIVVVFTAHNSLQVGRPRSFHPTHPNPAHFCYCAAPSYCIDLIYSVSKTFDSRCNARKDRERGG